MQAWVVESPAPVDAGPLRRIERPLPEPGPGQVRVRVRCCGVCRTDLHLAEGDLPPRRPAVVPGHEVVGEVDAVGPGARRFAVGERIGVAWLGRTDGSCRFCRRGEENLCTAPVFTGWDVDGGYADACLVDERLRLPAAGHAGRRAGRAAAVRRHHRLPGAALRRRPARRLAGHLRVRGQRAPDRPGGAGAGPARARVHPRRAQPAARRGAGGGLGRRGGRPVARAAGRRDPVRPGRGAGAGGPARARPRRHAGRRRDLAVAHPRPGLRRRAVPGAPAAQRHREHPGGRRGVPPPGRPARRPRHHGRPTPWPRPPTALADLAHGRFGGAAVLHN